MHLFKTHYLIRTAWIQFTVTFLCISIQTCSHFTILHYSIGLNHTRKTGRQNFFGIDYVICCEYLWCYYNFTDLYILWYFSFFQIFWNDEMGMEAV